MTTIAEIQQATADHFGLPSEVMTAKGREVFICRPRQIGMYLASQVAGASPSLIGRKFRRHHTTVLHALKTIHRLRKRNAYMEDHETYLGDAIGQIIAKLKGEDDGGSLHPLGEGDHVQSGANHARAS